jgi:hypothetical protein
LFQKSFFNRQDAKNAKFFKISFHFLFHIHLGALGVLAVQCQSGGNFTTNPIIKLQFHLVSTTTVFRPIRGW